MFRLPLAFALCTIAVCQGVPSEDDLVLLQPYLDQTSLGHGIEAYQLNGAVLVPLGEICRLLGFGITVDATSTTASGFFISPQRTFYLDLDKGIVEVETKRTPLAMTAKLPRDIYVDARSLGEWFPLEVSAYPKDSVLLFKAKEKLPIQEAWEREKKFGSSSMARYGEDEATTHGVYTPLKYSFLDLPMIDINLGISKASKASSQTTGSATLGGDLFWMSSDLFAARDAAGSWDNSRATLFREDPAGGILGPMRARSIVVGDLFSAPSIDLIGSLPQGRGLSIDNFPVTYRTRFASRTFRGSLAQGWSVEIFQNEGLIGFQQSRQDGLYEFKEVPLRFGVNTFKLVFHGPMGEKVEKTYRLDISQDQTPPGSFFYGLAGVKPTRNGAFAQPEVALASGYSYLAQADYGLNTTFSMQGGGMRLELPDGPHTYGSLGLRGVWSFLGFQLVAAQDQGPTSTGSAFEALLSTGYGYSTVTLRRDEFLNGFQRSQFNSTGLGVIGLTVKSATGIDVNWSAKVSERPLSISAQVEQEDYVEGPKGTRERLLISTQLGQVTLSNSTSVTHLPDSPTTLQGTFTGTSFHGNWSWNGNLFYDKEKLNGWGVLGQYHTASWQYQLGVNGALGASAGPLQLSAGVTKMSGRFGLGLNVQHAGSTYSASLQFQMSLGREPRTHKWIRDAQSLASSGSVSAISFLDANGNGKQDPEEPVLEGTRFKVGGGEAMNQISDQAVTFITKLPKSQPVDISLDESSLEDPSMQASVKTVTVLPRPGKVARVAFPVSNYGYINGTTRAERDGKRVELGGLEVEVLDRDGARLKVMRSSYDGFFEFTDLPYGWYTLRVPPEEVERMKILPFERPFQIVAGRMFLDGVDVVVKPERIKP